MTFRETTGLLTNESLDYRIRTRNYLSRWDRKSVLLTLCAGLIPLLLWIAIFQSLEVPEDPNPVLNSSGPQLELSPPPIKTNGSPKLRTGSPGQSQPSSSSKSQNPVFSTLGNRTIVKYTFVITGGPICPDNYTLPGLFINGKSPGPEIRVPQYSILIVQVINKLPLPVAIHFHGIHQRRSFLHDGVPDVTQKPIPPGGSYTHEIDTWPQVGTFFYHAHTGMDILWLFGTLIIEDDPIVLKTLPDPYQYDEDRVFILNGVYHDSVDNLVERIAGPVHDYPTVLSSLTTNGRSFGRWENVTGADSVQAPANSTFGYDITSVKKGLRYRFRFINAASDSLLTCNIKNHTFTIIETDGIYVEPVVTDHLVISQGQRYSLIITMDQPDDNYYISCRQMESPGPANGLSILNYEDGPKPSDEMRYFYDGSYENVILDRWIMDDLSPNYALDQTDVYKVPMGVDKEFVIDVFEAVVGLRHVYLMNGHYFEEPTIPYYMQLRNGLNISNPPQVYEIIEGDSVQFVFQNQRTGDFCFSHPWHIHGHSFYLVGEGPNRYDPVKDRMRIEEDVQKGKRSQLRDVVTVYANQTIGEETDGAFCGWAAVRFSAHNPGLWLAHCHVTPHMIMGKKFVIWEHPADDPQLSVLMAPKTRG